VPQPPESARRRWWLLPLMMIGLLIGLSMFVPLPTTDEAGYASFLREVDDGLVASVVVHPDSGMIDVVRADETTYEVQGPNDGIPDADLVRLDTAGVDREYAPASSNWFPTLLFTMLPVLLIVGAFVWLSRRTQSQLTGMSSFSRSKARVHTAAKTDITLDDVAGCTTVKEEIAEVIDFLRSPQRFSEVGARIPKGILLVGPPGTGKTLLARAIAGEAAVPFLSITGSEFLEMFVGVGAARVRDLFETARSSRPCIVFVDEIDAIGRKRGTGLGGGHDEREQALNQLLAEMDGFESTEGIVVLAATNRPDILDPALLRAGRFDRQIVVPLPTQVERAQILAVHCRDKRLGPTVDLDVVARGTPGMSGAELANLVNEAALATVRRGGREITGADLETARDRILMGIRRTSLVLDDDEQLVIAYHEAGHALLAQVLAHADPVHKVTILPAGVALGATHQLPIRERHLHRRPELDDALAVRLGGRAAEKLVFGEASSGAQDDLVGATQLARTMVREWGMSERLGHLAWGSQGAVFLGEDLVHTRDYSDETARVIDEETERILGEQARRALDVLSRRREALDAIARRLIERETLTGDEVEAIVSGDGMVPGATQLPFDLVAG
jgi:cell division protease FtsH